MMLLFLILVFGLFSSCGVAIAVGCSLRLINFKHEVDSDLRILVRHANDHAEAIRRLEAAQQFSRTDHVLHNGRDTR